MSIQTMMSKLSVAAIAMSLAMSGCMADSGDDPAEAEAHESDEPMPSDDAFPAAEDGAFDPDFFPPEAEVETIEADITKATGIGVTTFVCSSGWPGTRGCYRRILSPTDIVPGSVSASVDGRNGAVGYSASQVGPREIRFSASIHEGDAFNPGKNSTRFVVVWLRR